MSYTNGGMFNERCQCFTQCDELRIDNFAQLFIADDDDNDSGRFLQSEAGTCVVPGCPRGKKAGGKKTRGDDDDDGGDSKKSGGKKAGYNDDDGTGTGNASKRLGAAFHSGGTWHKYGEDNDGDTDINTDYRQ